MSATMPCRNLDAFHQSPRSESGGEYRNALIMLALVWSPVFLIAPGLLPMFVIACTVVVLALSSAWFIGRQWRRGATALLAWTICVAAYGGFLIAVPLANRPQLHELGETVGSDSFAGTVELVNRSSGSNGISYDLMVRVNNLTARTARSALPRSLAFAYLSDSQNRRFFPADIGSNDVFTDSLQPGESSSRSFSFTVPANARDLRFVVQPRRLTYASFIVGSGDLIGQPIAVFRIP